MTRLLKQSTAHTFRLGPFLDSTDGVTPETSLTLSQADFRLSKAGGAFAQKNDATSGTHDENGWYTCVLNSTDTNTLGSLTVNVNESGALPVWQDFMVLPANIYDSVVGGTDVLDVSVTQFGGTNGTFSSGRPEVNTTHAAGTAWNSGAIGASTLASDTITAAKIAADAIGASELASDAATEIGTAVWATTTRLLTAGTNIALAKGTGVTGFNDLDAAGVRAALGLASANLDTQISTVDTVVDAIKAKTDGLTFTVAGQVDANIQYVNDVAVSGNGQSGTEWSPA